MISFLKKIDNQSSKDQYGNLFVFNLSKESIEKINFSFNSVKLYLIFLLNLSRYILSFSLNSPLEVLRSSSKLYLLNSDTIVSKLSKNDFFQNSQTKLSQNILKLIIFKLYKLCKKFILLNFLSHLSKIINFQSSFKLSKTSSKNDKTSGNSLNNSVEKA